MNGVYLLPVLEGITPGVSSREVTEPSTHTTVL